MPKAGAGLEDRNPLCAALSPPLGALEPKPLDAAGAPPKPLGADAPNENAGWPAGRAPGAAI